MNDSIRVSQDAPLKKQDSEMKTYGCRHSNPEICGSHSVPSICAFVNSDVICRKPPRSWKRIYSKLRKNRNK